MTDAAAETDLFEMFGSTSAPASPSDHFWDSLTTGSCAKIHNLRYWLKFEMQRLEHMLECNIKLTKAVVRDGKATDAPISRLDFARVAVNYYLDMYHLPWFIPRDNFTPADRNTIVERIVAYPIIKELI